MSLIGEMREASDKLYQNLTISFSGYNIKDYIIRAVTSFLDLYPYLKENIVVFDDDSTDGTAEWLKENGIRRITWSDKYRSIAKEGEFSSTFYCNMIVRDIMYQVNTKYLLVSDGDVLFHGGFLEKYKELINEYKIIGTVVCEILTERLLDACLEDKLDLVTFEHDGVYYRLWQVHMLLDLDYFKEIGLEYDPIEIDYYTDNPDIDSGAHFLCEVMRREVPLYALSYFNDEHEELNPYRGKNNIFTHKGYGSCEQKYGRPK